MGVISNIKVRRGKKPCLTVQKITLRRIALKTLTTKTSTINRQQVARTVLVTKKGKKKMGLNCKTQMN